MLKIYLNYLKLFVLGRKVEVNDATVRVQPKKSNQNALGQIGANCGLKPGKLGNNNKLIIQPNIINMVSNGTELIRDIVPTLLSCRRPLGHSIQ